jgi:hypothetical protein
MLAVAMLGGAFGVVLGAHFKVFVLMPATLFASAATVVLGFGSGANLHAIFLAMLAILASLQFGFVAGGVTETYFSVRTRPPRRRRTASQ